MDIKGLDKIIPIEVTMEEVWTDYSVGYMQENDIQSDVKVRDEYKATIVGICYLHPARIPHYLIIDHDTKQLEIVSRHKVKEVNIIPKN